MIWSLAILAVSFAGASFFWLCGIWKNQWFACAVGLVLLVFSCLCAMGLSGTTDLLNITGICLMLLGVATDAAGRLNKVGSAKHANVYGALLFLLGLLLALLL